MWTILNTNDLSAIPEAVEALEAVGKFFSLPAERDLVLANLAEVDAYLASASVRIDAEFLDRAPRLKMIGSPSTGTDHMDLAEIRRRGIECFDIAREYELLNSFSATSELAFGMLLSIVRHIPPAIASAKEGDWARERYSGFQLLGKTFGILGLGRLGKISARIAQGFGMRVIAHDVRADASAPGVEMVDFDRLLRESDVLSIHIHLRPETDGLINAACFERMKPTAIVLNTSRGRIIDEADLLTALKSGRIAGAGLDVIDGEWLSREELRRHPLVEFARAHDNLVIVPHIGGSTRESIYGARLFMARKMADWIRNRTQQ
ncbi:MAG: NAD(P)-dependent oxidoreductase [Pseudomonadota bacterium]